MRTLASLLFALCLLPFAAQAAAPAILSTTGTETGNFIFVDSFDADLPATVNANDVLVAFFANDVNSNPITGPGGSWVEQINISGGGPKNIAVYTLIAVGTEDGGTVTATSGSTAGWQAQVLRIDSGTIDEAQEGTQNFGTSHDSPSATADGNDTLALYGLMGFTGSDLDWDGSPPTHPSGSTLDTAHSSEFNWLALAVAYETVSSGATGAATWTTGSINGTPWTILIAPAAGGGPAIPIFQHHQLQRMQ